MKLGQVIILGILLKFEDTKKSPKYNKRLF